VAALGAAGLGACAVLAACSPVQLGAAAIVGNQRITVSSLDTQVSNLQAVFKPNGSTSQLTTANMPSAVLSWLIRFEVWDQVAAANGISVTDAQSQAALSSLTSVAQQNGYSSTSQLLIDNGVPPQLFPQVGRWDAQETAYELQANGGKQPTTTTEQNTVSAAVTKAQCTAAKSLTIQVSPQFGRLDYTQYTIVAAPSLVTRTAGPAPTASPSGQAPAC